MFLIHIAQHPCNCFNHFFRFLFSPPLINSYLFIANLFLFHCGIFYICCSHAPQLAETINYYSYHCLFFLAYRHNHNLCLSAIYFHTTFYRIQIYHSFGKTEMSCGCSWCLIGFHSWSLLPILYRVTIAGIITAFEAPVVLDVAYLKHCVFRTQTILAEMALTTLMNSAKMHSMLLTYVAVCIDE